MKNIVVFMLILLFLPGAGSGQVQDTLKTVSNDTLSTNTKLDSIDYSAENAEIDVINNIYTLTGTEESPARVQYLDMTLTAYKIIYFIDGDSVIAEGLTVEANPDSFPGGKRMIGEPTIIQPGQEPLAGKSMTFNLVTRKGVIQEGTTEFEGGHYFGQNITRINEDIIQIEDGYFTSCDRKGDPHFHFRSKQMKLTIKDKVVARPIVFYIADIPIMMLPFGVFPLSDGRSSGFIIPSYGSNEQQGRFLEGGGYYWAGSDYHDVTVLTDFYDKSGFLFRGNTNYSKRYSFRGSISGSFTKKDFEVPVASGDSTILRETGQRNWQLNIRHNQEFEGRNMNLSVSGSFQGGKDFDKNFSRNRDIRSRRGLVSNATLNKRWSKTSLSVNASRREDLVSGNVTQTFPSATFNLGSPVYPFRKENANGRDESFLSSFNFSYNSTLNNQRTKTPEIRILPPFITRYRVEVSPPDSSIEDPVFEPDSSRIFVERISAGIRHNMNFSAPQKILTHFSVNPSFRYEEQWFNEAQVLSVDEFNKEVTQKETGIFTRRTFSASVGANTKFYGVFNPNIGKLKTIRHVVTPSLTFSYRPDFTDPQYGYTATYTDTSGKEVEYDRFGNSVFGRTPSGESRSLGLNVSNLFQVKTQDGDIENKFDILNISSSLNYNFALEDGERKFSNISSSIRSPKFPSLSMSMSHSLYAFDVDSTGREFLSNEFLYKRGSIFNFARLQNLSLHARFSFKSKQKLDKGSESAEESPQPQTFLDQSLEEQANQNFRDINKPINELANQTVPWDVNFQTSMQIIKSNPQNTIKTWTATMSANVQLTEGWRVGYSGGYDLVDTHINYHSFAIYRDLHCWEMTIDWTPSSSSVSGLFLEIRVKDPKLRDLRLKKSSRTLGIR